MASSYPEAAPTARAGSDTSSERDAVATGLAWDSGACHAAAMTITQRMRSLDRRVGFYKEPTPDQWRRMARGWRASLATACFLGLMMVGFSIFAPGGAGAMSSLVFFVIYFAFNAGQMQVEDSRLRGVVDCVAGHRRPDSL